MYLRRGRPAADFRVRYVARAAMRSCSDTSASCSRSGSIAVGSTLAVAGITKASSPFRLNVAGSGFQAGVAVAINGAPWTNVSYKGPAKLVIKGGSALEAAVPKGQMVTFHFTNPDGSSADFPWSW